MKATITGEVISILDTITMLVRCERNEKLVKIYITGEFDPWLPDLKKLPWMEVRVKGLTEFLDGEIIVDPEVIEIWRLGKGHTRTSPSEAGNIYKRIKRKK